MKCNDRRAIAGRKSKMLNLIMDGAGGFDNFFCTIYTVAGLTNVVIYMKKATAKAQKKVLKTLSENQFGVILEDINRKFDVLVEGHGVLDKKIDTVKDELGERIDDLSGAFNSFRKDTESNFQTVFKHLSKIEDELSSVKAEIEDLKRTLTRKADMDRVVLLEKRVAKMEHQLIALAK